MKALVTSPAAGLQSLGIFSMWSISASARRFIVLKTALISMLGSLASTDSRNLARIAPINVLTTVRRLTLAVCSTLAVVTTILAATPDLEYRDLDFGENNRAFEFACELEDPEPDEIHSGA